MADGQVEAVALLPFGVGRVQAQGMEVGHRQQVGGAQGLANITLALDLTHAQGMATDIVGAHSQGQCALWGRHSSHG